MQAVFAILFAALSLTTYVGLALHAGPLRRRPTLREALRMLDSMTSVPNKRVPADACARRNTGRSNSRQVSLAVSEKTIGKGM